MSFLKPGSVLARQSSVVDDGVGGGGGGETSSVAFNFSSSPLDLQRRSLPIYKHRRQILFALEKYPVVVIVGETGSGKSTQIPQYLHENGWTDSGFAVACTQPRRVAAQTLAARVAQEAGTELGDAVGYSVRFDDMSGPHTAVRYVTDGMLLREAAMSDPLLSRYSAVMIDEAHERNLNTDALLGVVKKVRRKRRDLRVIVCSATIDAEAFLDFFVPKRKRGGGGGDAGGGDGDDGGAKAGRKRKRRWGKVGEDDNPEPSAEGKKPDEELVEDGTIISIDGRQHPVDVLYSVEPVPDYVQAAVDTALRIHFEAGGGPADDGDVLCFLPSGEDVDRAVSLAEETLPAARQSHSAAGGGGGRATKRPERDVVFLPLYGALPLQMQARIFRPRSPGDDARRVIFSTNIAETSVTVPGVSSVIDCGFAKVPHFDPATGFDRLVVCPISRASARQRAGRAGRLGPGKCYRLYREAAVAQKMEAAAPPEVLRTNLTSFILTLKAMGVGNVLAFDLMSVPSVDALAHGLECLYALGAVNDKTDLTERGNVMAEFPTEPRVSRMLLESLRLGCASDVLSVAAALQVRSLFHRPRTEAQRRDRDAALAELVDSGGSDHVACANLMAAHRETPLDEGGCRERFVNRTALRRAAEVRAQLRRFLRRYGDVGADDAGGGRRGERDEEGRSAAVRRCVAAGFFFNVAKLGNDGRYYTLRGRRMVLVSKDSALSRFGRSTEYIVFGETYDGSRGGIEVRWCSSVQSRWLREVAPHYWA